MAKRKPETFRTWEKQNPVPGSEQTESPCESGSIEQQLDMCETGQYKGDDVLSRRNELDLTADNAFEDEDEMYLNYNTDMSETDREGDEMSGDEHSSGLQGGEPELAFQGNVDKGPIPGGEEEREVLEQRREHNKRGAA